jgi:hypothetical protein
MTLPTRAGRATNPTANCRSTTVAPGQSNQYHSSLTYPDPDPQGSRLAPKGCKRRQQGALRAPPTAYRSARLDGCLLSTPYYCRLRFG